MGFEDIVTKADLKAFEARITAMLKNAVAPAKDAYLNEKEAAAYIKLKPKTLGDMARAGEIASIKAGRRRMYATTDLDAYMKACRIVSDAEAASAAVARA